ncbi:DsbA family oxidoreductase [Aliarcobacter cryaerophilus]|uniref:DsbA family oxidoreductase n=1 Tax=Aliarcobacter cryaerophilus TaxID=28198 RepID=UPI000826377A|nr:DsbA family oxidoreductase [Aliarcobacter cryaerophilus]
MTVEVWSDFSCPFCYIGKTRLERVLDSFIKKAEVNLMYKTFILAPDAPQKNDENAYLYFSKLKGINIDEAKHLFLNISKTAKQDGLDINWDKVKMTSTYKAHKFCKFMREKGLEDKIITKLMVSYFELGLNLADDETLYDIAKEFNIDKKDVEEALQNHIYDEIIKNELSEAKNMKVLGVPFFLFDKKYLISGIRRENEFLEIIEKCFY